MQLITLPHTFQNQIPEEKFKPAFGVFPMVPSEPKSFPMMLKVRIGDELE
jgi:hypothetical protein